MSLRSDAIKLTQWLAKREKGHIRRTDNVAERVRRIRERQAQKPTEQNST